MCCLDCLEEDHIGFIAATLLRHRHVPDEEEAVPLRVIDSPVSETPEQFGKLEGKLMALDGKCPILQFAKAVPAFTDCLIDVPFSVEPLREAVAGKSDKHRVGIAIEFDSKLERVEVLGSVPETHFLEATHWPASIVSGSQSCVPMMRQDAANITTNRNSTAYPNRCSM